MSNKKEKRKKLDEKLNITTVSDEREVLVNLQVVRATTSIAILSSSYGDRCVPSAYQISQTDRSL
jgi:hypothetical protein